LYSDSYQVYNKNGRIGIYTPAERAVILAKFNAKRSRRVWNKKIRYNCRKNLADRRMRVKGRFVKRSVEEPAKSSNKVETMTMQRNLESDSCLKKRTIKNESSSIANPRKYSNLEDAPKNDSNQLQVLLNQDTHMPNVNDVEAGFRPTSSQPYRRTRRHTIL